MCVLTHYGAQCCIYTLIFKRALISGCLLVRICFWQVERIFPSQAEIYQTRSNEHFLSFHWLSLIQKNRPHNERNSVPRAEICKTSRFGFLEQKFARAEISVLLKLQVCIYIILYTLICGTKKRIENWARQKKTWPNPPMLAIHPEIGDVYKKSTASSSGLSIVFRSKTKCFGFKLTVLRSAK